MSAGTAAYRMPGNRTYSSSSKHRTAPAFSQIAKLGSSRGAADQKGGFRGALDCVLDLYVPFDIQQEPADLTDYSRQAIKHQCKIISLGSC